jgi:alpha-glucoside transport system substrate-binding protein
MAAVAVLTSGCLQEPNQADNIVEVFGAFSGDEQAAFEASIADFEASSGIDVRYTASSDFTTFIRSRVLGGDPPDVALFPQPGLLLNIAARGALVPIDEYLDVDQLNETLIPGFLDATTDEDGVVWGAPMRMAVKSLVWVPNPQFEDAGYSLEPPSFQDLLSESEEIEADGTAPWCIGYESGAATGWVGTDWIEEMVLRIAGPEVYDQWVNHEIPFNDPVIKEAFNEYGEIVFGDGLVAGGSGSIVTTPFGTAGNGAFDDPPRCYMQRQGNFIAGFFPEDVQANLDTRTNLFAFPPYDGGYDGQPILGGGDLAALLNRGDAASEEFMRFLTSDQFGAEWAQAGGWLSPHATFDLDNYADETTRRIAAIASDADVFRFDGSDSMPAQVGSGTFWTGMVEWTSGAKTTDQVVDEIEEGWPD